MLRDEIGKLNEHLEKYLNIYVVVIVIVAHFNRHNLFAAMPSIVFFSLAKIIERHKQSMQHRID